MPPISKRSTERRRRNKVPGQEKVEAAGEVAVPAAGDWHPLAMQWYESLKESGQSQFFEPSDWIAAHYVAEAMTRNLAQTRFSAQLFSVVWQGMNELLTTEGARRRARLEVERVVAERSKDEPTAIDRYRKMMA